MSLWNRAYTIGTGAKNTPKALATVGFRKETSHADNGNGNIFIMITSRRHYKDSYNSEANSWKGRGSKQLH